MTDVGGPQEDVARSGRAAKRAIDIAVAGAGMVIASPLMAAIALAIRLETPGPVIFRQERVGLHGSRFRIHKFRSLRVEAGGGLISPTGDPRITRVGAVLRRSKLDELPQLLDVLAGSMSMVGPRPEVPRYVDLWPPAARDVILSVRPGITDPASLVFRYEADELAQADDAEEHYVASILPRKVAMYVEYVRTWSLMGDVGVLWATLIPLTPWKRRGHAAERRMA